MIKSRVNEKDSEKGRQMPPLRCASVGMTILLA